MQARVIVLAAILVTGLAYSIFNDTQNVTAQMNLKKNNVIEESSDLCKDTGNYLTTFSCGRTASDGAKEFTLVVNEHYRIPITEPTAGERPTEDNSVMFKAWTFNGSIPGPTMRVTEGDKVRITLVNDGESDHPHSLHLHSYHSGDMDGTMGESSAVAPNDNFTYTFTAGPSGVFPYHCHMAPITNHVNRGLYGVFIIDPKVPREPMPEMVMVMNGYDLNLDAERVTDFVIPTPQQANDMMSNDPTDLEQVADLELGQERDNEIYTVNGRAFQYNNAPITVGVNDTYRIYLVNMLEFDPLNNFHVHGTVFKYFPAGTADTAPFVTDIVSLNQGDRGIMEMSFPQKGMFMFHAHVTEFTDLGWMGMFMVTDEKEKS